MSLQGSTEVRTSKPGPNGVAEEAPRGERNIASKLVGVSPGGAFDAAALKPGANERVDAASTPAMPARCALCHEILTTEDGESIECRACLERWERDEQEHAERELTNEERNR